MSDARQPDRPLIALNCPEDRSEQVAHLCDALVQALAEASGAGHVVRRIASAPPKPQLPGDIGISLRIDSGPGGSLTAHLDWQADGPGPGRSGPLLRFDPADAGGDPAPYLNFARALVSADPQIRAALQ